MSNTISEQVKQKAEEIIGFAKASFNVPFEFNQQEGEDGSLWLIGPFGTFCIALNVHSTEKPEDRFDAISVSVEADPHFVATATHAFANMFGLVYMDPHAAGINEEEGQIIFGRKAYEIKAIVDEAKVRAKVVELTREAVTQVAEEPRLRTPAKDILDVRGMPLK